VGPTQYRVEFVNWPPLQGKEDAEDKHPPASPWSSQDGALVKIRGFVIKWGAHLSTLAAGSGCSTGWS
jgi:hypothetical protein